MVGDFNYDTFKTPMYQFNSNDSEDFTNILAGFNMYKLIIYANSNKTTICTIIRQL